MTAARGVAFGALVVAAAIVAVLLLTGSKTHEYSIVFQNAGQLVKDDDVQIGGRRIGSVRKLALTKNNLAKIDIAVEDGYAPLKEGTTAVIRQTSLSGIANRYIALTPGSGPGMDDGTTIPSERSTSPVDLDQLFNTLDARTRKGLQQFIQGGAEQFKGKAEQANEAAKYFNPTLSTSRALVNEVVRDQVALNQFIKKGAAVTGALAERKGDLTNLVSNANTTAAAIAAENSALEQTLSLLPPTLRRANTTFVNLRGTLGDLTTLVDASKPATRRLAPFLRELRPLVADARPTIRDLRTLISRPGEGNDLIELLQRTPTLERVAKPAFDNTTKALRRSTPTLTFIRPYVPELEGWFRDFGQGASNYDANGHFARIQPIFNTFSFTDNPAGGLLAPTTPGLRLNGLSTGNVRRCPGAASQPAKDGSSPYRGEDGKLDCDPTKVLPGP